ncbi:MAG TPA: hypothetical protein VMW08_01860 [Acidimicrobiales bacterium]|nr:hypothetical protein [Acidimicrobiales bacterium]
MEPEDLHEWVSFEDTDEERTWVFDLTFLLSNWTCIYGRGCPGVLTGPAPELEHGCCSYGAHFVGDEDLEATLGYAERLTETQWQFKKLAAKRGGPTRVTQAGDHLTRLVDGACIFLNRTNFDGGAGCALHRAAVEHDERPLDWKPDVCWQLPLRLSEETDEHGYVTSTLREWKRRDWGDGGQEFHWWCTDAGDAFIGAQAVYRVLADEIVEMIGEVPYRQLCEHIESRRATQYLPHPMSRRQLQ